MKQKADLLGQVQFDEEFVPLVGDGSQLDPELSELLVRVQLHTQAKKFADAGLVRLELLLSDPSVLKDQNLPFLKPMQRRKLRAAVMDILVEGGGGRQRQAAATSSATTTPRASIHAPPMKSGSALPASPRHPRRNSVGRTYAPLPTDPDEGYAELRAVVAAALERLAMDTKTFFNTCNDGHHAFAVGPRALAHGLRQVCGQL